MERSRLPLAWAPRWAPLFCLYYLKIFGYTKANPLGVRLAFLVMAVFVFAGFIIFRKYRVGDTLEETCKNLNLPAPSTSEKEA